MRKIVNSTFITLDGVIENPRDLPKYLVSPTLGEPQRNNTTVIGGTPIQAAKGSTGVAAPTATTLRPPPTLVGACVSNLDATQPGPDAEPVERDGGL